MKYIKNKLRIDLLMLLFAAIGLASCADDKFYIEGAEGVDDGKCRINATIDYKQFSSSNLGSRTAGEIYDGIRNLRVFVFDEDGKKVQNETIDVNALKKDEDVETINNVEYTVRLKFNLTIPYGKYRIYAAANMPDGWTGADVETVADLKAVNLNWIQSTADDGSVTIGKNDEMFGTFYLASSFDAETEVSTGESASEDPFIEINSPTTSLKAPLIRAASKVTVAYDGSGLKEGVKIYIKSLKLKNIAKTCYLANDKTVSAESDIIEDGEGVVYSTSTAYDESFPGLIDKDNPYFPRKTVVEEGGDPTWDTPTGPHSHTSEQSLFFYENLQGEGPDKSAMKDENKDGLLDEFYDYSQKPYGTYIEVEAYYESVNPERPDIGNITYRFMLGQDILKDYNAKRNCHYKLTLKFRGFANEPDWRIDYVSYFGVTQPKVVDYRGKFFVPNENYDNRGNTFSDQNIITITNYEFENDSWNNRYALDFEPEFYDADGKKLPGCPDWITGFEDISTAAEKSKGITKLLIKYKNPYTEIKELNKAFKDDVTGTYDLATKGGTTETANTANSYIIDAGGTYSLPLVYGNAVQNGAEVKSTYTGLGIGEMEINTLKNYKNEDITSGYILEDLGISGDDSKISASLIWQDSKGLINENVTYNKDMYSYGGKNRGGISFSIGTIA